MKDDKDWLNPTEASQLEIFLEVISEHLREAKTDVEKIKEHNKEVFSRHDPKEFTLSMAYYRVS